MLGVVYEELCRSTAAPAPCSCLLLCLIEDQSKKEEMRTQRTSTWRVEDKRLTLTCHDDFIKDFTKLDSSVHQPK